MDVINANALLEKILRFRKFPKSPPIKTAKNSGQYKKKSLRTLSLVNWPKIPEIEFISINNDAVVTIFLGLSAFINFHVFNSSIINLPPSKTIMNPIIKKSKRLQSTSSVIFFINNGI